MGRNSMGRSQNAGFLQVVVLIFAVFAIHSCALSRVTFVQAQQTQHVQMVQLIPASQRKVGGQTKHKDARSQRFPSALVTGCFLAAAATSATTLSARRSEKRQQKVACAASEDVGVVLLSGGVGKRMGAGIPKQYIKLMGLEIALHSLDTFLDCDVSEIVIVCAEEWQHIFKDHLEKRGALKCELKFTGGGKERQGSVRNGLAKITTPIVAIHDSARPLVTKEEMEKVVADAAEYGAALLAVPTKATIKQAVATDDNFVAATPKRKLLWEAHTPQVIRSDLLRKGFEKAEKEDLEVTDDVSLVELLGEKVKLTEGEYTNIKVTTPEDIAVAETILKQRGFVSPEWSLSFKNKFFILIGSIWIWFNATGWTKPGFNMACRWESRISTGWVKKRLAILVTCHANIAKVEPRTGCVECVISVAISVARSGLKF